MKMFEFCAFFCNPFFSSSSFICPSAPTYQDNLLLSVTSLGLIRLGRVTLPLWSRCSSLTASTQSHRPVLPGGENKATEFWLTLPNLPTRKKSSVFDVNTDFHGVSLRLSLFLSPPAVISCIYTCLDPNEQRRLFASQRTDYDACFGGKKDTVAELLNSEMKIRWWIQIKLLSAPAEQSLSESWPAGWSLLILLCQRYYPVSLCVAVMPG